MLANNRTPKETARAKYEINSIKTNRGTKAKGLSSLNKIIYQYFFEELSHNPVASCTLQVHAAPGTSGQSRGVVN